jgi:transcriptional antiterminator
MIYINARCRSILKILLNHDNYLQPVEIAGMLKVSKRSIYYDFYRINDWLSYYDIEELEIVRGKGILLKKFVKEAIEEALQESQQDEEYIFSPMERGYIIYCSIMYEEKAVYIEQLMEYCGVSRNTIFNDLGILKSQLKDYDLELAYEPKTGYYLVGDPVKARAVFIMNFNKLQNLYKTNRLSFLNKKKIEEIFKILTDIEKTLKIRYVEGGTSFVICIISSLVKRHGDTGVSKSETK